MTDTLERNKKNVVAFYDLMFNQSRPREAMGGRGGQVPCPQDKPVDSPFGVRDLTTAQRRRRKSKTRKEMTQHQRQLPRARPAKIVVVERPR